MQNKKIVSFGFLLIVLLGGLQPALADDVYVESADVFVEDSDGDFVEENSMDEVAMDAIENYSPDGSLFQQITDLEQEKILMQLEKERAQLDLELDRLAAEKIKLHMEIDTLSGRAEQQQQEIETQKAKLEAEAIRLEREKESLIREAAEEKSYNRPSSISMVNTPVEAAPAIAQDYRLVNVIGAGNQLQATVADLSSGQTKRISVGKKLDNWTVKSISLDDGVVFVSADGETQNLNVSNGK